MTVYELIQELVEFDADAKVVVSVYGDPKHFKEYLDEGIDGEYLRMWIEGTVDRTEQDYNSPKVEIVCELERL